MDIGISDIQKLPNGNIELSLCTYPDCEEVLKLIVDRRTMWEIHDYCQKYLSYGAQLREQKLKSA